MKLVTRLELEGKDISQLRGIMKHCFNELVKSDANSATRLNALGSIENIQNEISSRAKM